MRRPPYPPGVPLSGGVLAIGGTVTGRYLNLQTLLGTRERANVVGHRRLQFARFGLIK